MTTDFGVAEKTRTKTNLRPPSMFKVIYLNDSKTTVEFVVESLMKFFNHAKSTSENFAQEIHTTGAATVAILPFELAEQKGTEVTIAARSEGYPLQIKIERDPTS